MRERSGHAAFRLVSSMPHQAYSLISQIDSTSFTQAFSDMSVIMSMSQMISVVKFGTF